ncbi:hypothetical protein ABZ470_31820 [Streptosporangium sp. NPDC020072]|uniref:hypothetical protein n=1 Tax=Streptosporangium sp. NPDC020072 TaxID=3154788 RepID=UPI00343EFB1C
MVEIPKCHISLNLSTASTIHDAGHPTWEVNLGFKPEEFGMWYMCLCTRTMFTFFDQGDATTAKYVGEYHFGDEENLTFVLYRRQEDGSDLPREKVWEGVYPMSLPGAEGFKDLLGQYGRERFSDVFGCYPEDIGLPPVDGA